MVVWFNGTAIAAYTLNAEIHLNNTEFFFALFCSPPPLGPTYPPVQWLPWALRVKRPERKADHSI
jgi:hypothetical protein